MFNLLLSFSHIFDLKLKKLFAWKRFTVIITYSTTLILTFKLVLLHLTTSLKDNNIQQYYYIDV